MPIQPIFFYAPHRRAGPAARRRRRIAARRLPATCSASVGAACTPVRREVKDYTTYQIGALQAFLLRGRRAVAPRQAATAALYMMAPEDTALARAIAEATAAAAEGLQFDTIRGSAADDAARRAGLQVVAEFFADRGYQAERLGQEIVPVDHRRGGRHAGGYLAGASSASC